MKTGSAERVDELHAMRIFGSDANVADKLRFILLGWLDWKFTIFPNTKQNLSPVTRFKPLCPCIPLITLLTWNRYQTKRPWVYPFIVDMIMFPEFQSHDTFSPMYLLVCMPWYEHTSCLPKLSIPKTRCSVYTAIKRGLSITTTSHFDNLVHYNAAHGVLHGLILLSRRCVSQLVTRTIRRI